MIHKVIDIFRFFLVFYGYFFEPFRSIPHMSTLVNFLLPIVLWWVPSFRTWKNYPIYFKILKSYIIFDILILLTASFSPYPIGIPLERFVVILTMISMIYFGINSIKSYNKLEHALIGIMIASFLVTIHLYKNNFVGFAFVLTDYDTTGGDVIGNKNYVGNVMMLGVIAASLLSYFRKNFMLLISIGSYFLLSAFFTLSFKVIIVSTVIYFFVMSNLIDQKRVKIFSVFILISIIAFILISPILSDYFVSDEFMIISDKFFNTIGMDDKMVVGTSSREIRERLMSTTIQQFYIYPLTGIGLENIRLIMGTYSHNTYIETLAGGGVILFSSFVLLLVNIFVFFFKNRKIDWLPLIVLGGVIFISNAQSIYSNYYMLVLFIFVRYVELEIKSIRNENSLFRYDR